MKSLIYYNKSYTYALPMLDWWSSDFLVNSQLRGVFIGDIRHPELDNHILLVYRYCPERWYAGYEEELRDSGYFVDSYEPDKQHTVYVYTVPKHHDFNFKMLKQSYYSKFEDSYKKQIVEFHGKENTRKVIAVMYRHESMYLEWEKRINKDLPQYQWTLLPRDGECAERLHDNEEIFDNQIVEMLKSQGKEV